MINYILFFLIPPLLIYIFSKSNTYRIFSWILVFFFLLFLSTFRDQIGSDQGDYQLTFSKQFYNFDPEDFPTYELLYSYIEWFSYKLKLGFHGVNFMCGLIYLFGFIILIKDEKRSWLCLLISLPYFYFAVSWGFLRQGLSLGFIFMAVYFYKNNKIPVHKLIFEHYKKENSSSGDARPTQFALVPGTVTTGGSTITGVDGGTKYMIVTNNLTSAPSAGMADTDELTAKIEAVQALVNTARVQAGSQYAAI